MGSLHYITATYAGLKIAVVFFVFAALIMWYNYEENVQNRLCKIRNQTEAQRHVSNSGSKTLDIKRELFIIIMASVSPAARAGRLICIFTEGVSSCAHVPTEV